MKKINFHNQHLNMRTALEMLRQHSTNAVKPATTKGRDWNLYPCKGGPTYNAEITEKERLKEYAYMDIPYEA